MASIGGLLIIVSTYYFLFMRDEGPKPDREPVPAKEAVVSCETKIETVSMIDDVMEKTIKPEEKVQVEMGYYNCKDPSPGDVVLVQTSGRPDPIIRFVKVLPKDSFQLEARQNSFVLKVNGAVMQNGEGKPYLFSEQKSRLLKLYEKSLKGKMEDGIYFIFSNKLDGGYDSTRFGPVEKAKFVGRVILSKAP